MTLNGIMALILHYFTEFGSFRAYYIKLVEDRLIQSGQKCSLKNLVIFTPVVVAEDGRLPHEKKDPPLRKTPSSTFYWKQSIGQFYC